MGILYTSGLCIAKGAREGVIGGPFYKTCGVRDLQYEPRLLRMGVSIVEFNVLDINIVIFHNSSHGRLMGGGGGGGCSASKRKTPVYVKRQQTYNTSPANVKSLKICHP